jgi:hypothetical protein
MSADIRRLRGDGKVIYNLEFRETDVAIHRMGDVCWILLPKKYA